MKKFGLYISFFKIIHACAFSGEINFEKIKKVVKNLIEGVKIQTPVTLTFFHDKSKLEVVRFLNHHNYTVSGSGGG